LRSSNPCTVQIIGRGQALLQQQHGSNANGALPVAFGLWLYVAPPRIAERHVVLLTERATNQMPKGQQRSNREIRKATKPKPGLRAPSFHVTPIRFDDDPQGPKEKAMIFYPATQRACNGWRLQEGARPLAFRLFLRRGERLSR